MQNKLRVLVWFHNIPLQQHFAQSAMYIKKAMLMKKQLNKIQKSQKYHLQKEKKIFMLVIFDTVTYPSVLHIYFSVQHNFRIKASSSCQHQLSSLPRPTTSLSNSSYFPLCDPNLSPENQVSSLYLFVCFLITSTSLMLWSGIQQSKTNQK